MQSSRGQYEKEGWKEMQEAPEMAEFLCKTHKDTGAPEALLRQVFLILKLLLLILISSKLGYSHTSLL